MSISNAAAGGAPLDPALIAQLANEFFAALPGHAGPPAGGGLATAPPATPPVEVGALPSAAGVPPSSAVGNLSGSELRSAPATLSGAKLPLPQAGLSPGALPVPYEFRPTLIPAEAAPALPSAGAVPAAPAAASPEAGFPAPSPEVPSPPGSIPTEAALRALPATLAETDANRTVPADQASAGGAPAAASYYFLAAAPASRPAAGVALPAGDHGFDPAMLPELALVAGPYDPRLGRDFPH